MADPVDTTSTKLPHHRRRETRSASGVPSRAGGAGCCGGGAASELAPGKRAHLALDDPEKSTWLLEEAFLLMVEENELFMPAVEQLYAAVQEAEASVTVLEARRPQGHQRRGR